MNETSAAAGAIAGPIAKGRVAFVGVGPGDPGLLTLRASELLRSADIIVYGPEPLPALVSSFVRPDAQVLRARTGPVPAAVPGMRPPRPGEDGAAGEFDFASYRLPPGTDHVLVVRLCGEDPGLWTPFGDEVAAARDSGFEVEAVPGISTVSMVPAYIGVPLISDGSSSVFTSWGPSISGADFAEGPAGAVPVVLVGTREEVAAKLDSLLRAGRDPGALVSLTEKTTTLGQRTVTSTLADAGATIGTAGLTSPVVAVVSETVARRAAMEWFETRPLFAWRVLVPRTKDQAGSTVSRLAEYGAIGEVVPTISVEPPRSPHQIRRAINGLVSGRYQWVAFTSVNAVRAVRERLAEVGLDSRALAGVKVASVGGITAAALRQWGVESDLVPATEHSSRGLVGQWPPYDPELDPINRVFLPRADIATETLVAGLRDLGWDPEDVTAYRTVRASPPPAPVRDAIKKGHFDAVLFTSSSTVRNLVGIAGKPHPSTVVACIGNATARTARELGLNVSIVAPVASVDALVDALAAFGRERQSAALAEGRPLLRPSERRRQRR